jgi:hypothetical protein
MKLKSLALMAIGLLASNAMAACYTVYDRSNLIAYQGEMPPVDMSQPLRDALQRRFPGGHMVFEQTAVCPSIGIAQVARPAGVTAPPNTLVMGSGPNRKVAVAKTVETQVAMSPPPGIPNTAAMGAGPDPNTAIMGGPPNTAVMGAGPSRPIVTQRSTVFATTHARSMVGSSPLLTDRGSAVAMGVPYTQLSGDVVMVAPRAAAR